MITTVFDNFENLYQANEVNAPQRGLCILCRARMYRRMSELGTPHYALLPGQHHLYEDCRKLDGSKRTFSLRDTSPRDIWDFYFPDAVDEDTLNVGGTKQHQGTPRGPAGEKKCKIISLAQLCATGCFDSKDQLMGGGRWLSSVCINPKFSYMLLGLEHIGRRILQGRPYMANDDTQVIYFKVFIHKNIMLEEINVYKDAEVHFKDPHVYRRVKKRLFEEFFDFRSRSWNLRRRYDSVAIVADWNVVPRGECKCSRACEAYGWTCIGRINAEIEDAKCIYPLPHAKKCYENNDCNTSCQTQNK